MGGIISHYCTNSYSLKYPIIIQRGLSLATLYMYSIYFCCLVLVQCAILSGLIPLTVHNTCLPFDFYFKEHVIMGKVPASRDKVSTNPTLHAPVWSFVDGFGVAVSPAEV